MSSAFLPGASCGPPARCRSTRTERWRRAGKRRRERPSRTSAARSGAAGADWPDVVKLTIFVVDVSELATIRAVRDEFVNTASPPTSSLVQVAGLFRPDVLIEIEAVAHVP